MGKPLTDAAARRAVSLLKAGVVALHPHRDIPEILRRAHRFRATDKAGLLALAKDLARLTADCLDATAIKARLKTLNA